ncbi:MAG: hypothetical protein ACWGQW_20375 [bacterium]
MADTNTSVHGVAEVYYKPDYSPGGNTHWTVFTFHDREGRVIYEVTAFSRSSAPLEVHETETEK